MVLERARKGHACFSGGTRNGDIDNIERFHVFNCFFAWLKAFGTSIYLNGDVAFRTLFGFAVFSGIIQFGIRIKESFLGRG